RYPGHRDLVHFLMNKCDYSDRSMYNLFKSGCDANLGFREIPKDSVRLYVDEWSENGLVWHKEHVFLAGSKFSAMQRTTGYSIAAAADLLVSGQYRHSDDTTSAGLIMTYEMLNVPTFHENFNKLLSSDAVKDESSWI
ncbi:uncharacterized protein METZ01_LOCUS420681, partial [marine metagenome]